MGQRESFIGPLSWVQGEITLTLAQVETRISAATELPQARSRLHQCQGALTLVGLTGAARFVAAMEALLPAEGQSPPWDETKATALLAASATLRSYLEGLLAGAPDQPLALYPAYRQLALAAQTPVPSPAILFFPDLAQLPPPRSTAPATLSEAQISARLKAAALGFERGRQKWLKSHDGGEPGGLRDMRNSVAIVEQTRATAAARRFWWICIAFCDGIQEDIADPDRRGLLDRLFLALGEAIQALARQEEADEDTLLREVLYQVAVADGTGADSESVRQVRGVYRLADFIPPAAADGLRARETAQCLARLEEPLAAAEAAWEAFARGSAAALPAFHGACQRMASLALALERSPLHGLIGAIDSTAAQLRKNPLLHNDTLTEEMVAALLLLAQARTSPAQVDTTPFLQASAGVAEALAAALGGELLAVSAQAFTAYRRQQLDQTALARLCAVMQGNLNQVEAALEAAIRQPEQPELLAAVPLLLKQVEGALTVAEQPKAARLIADIMAALARLSYPGRGPVRSADGEDAARTVAACCVALGAYIDGLAWACADPALLEKAAAISSASLAEPARQDRADAAVAGELLAIFLDEGQAVLAEMARCLPQLQAQPEDGISLRALRRGFHTLKGGSRMVELRDLGDVAQAGELCLNAWLAGGAAANIPLLALLTEAAAWFGRCLAALEKGESLPAAADLAARFTALEIPAAGSGGDAAANSQGPLPPFLDSSLFDELPEELESGIDTQLLPLFLEESTLAVAAIGKQLRLWRADPADAAAPIRLTRLLHTLKGSARMVGALGIGELVHELESRIAEVNHPEPAQIDALADSFDRVAALIEALGGEEGSEDEALAPESAQEISAAAASVGQLHIRPERVDQLLNEAGEIAIARSRIETELREFKGTLGELGDTVTRLQRLWRDLELQGQPSSPQGGERSEELKRLLVEGITDVATVQQGLLRGLEQTTASLGAQSRLNRHLSQGLLRLRMVPFAVVVERLHRVLRRTAQELGKEAVLHCEGEQTEVDRSVLERLVAPLEHLLRNALAHGIETPLERQRKGKDAVGAVHLRVRQQGNEFLIELADDGAGLDLARIRQRGEASGLVPPGAEEAALIPLIFSPGFTTASHLSSVAGRGVGMDVVRSEVVALGGRIEVDSEADQGCLFRLTLPLTLSVGQALLVRVGGAPGRRFGIPAALVDQACEVSAEEMQTLRREGCVTWHGQPYVWDYLPHLLGYDALEPGRQSRYWRVLVRSGEERIALEVDAVIGKQEVVLKPLGPQLERVPGIVGATVLGDGEIALLLNPAILAARPHQVSPIPPSALPPRRPLVLLVDDSLTVRKTLARLLERAGYRVATARNGVEAQEKLQEERPAVLLADSDMPRLDGLDLVRSLGSDEQLKTLPVIMISACDSAEHRRRAEALGIQHFLAKPWDEAQLLSLIDHCLHSPS